MAETNDYTLHLTDESELDGLLEDVKERARQEALSSEREGWVFTLQAPSFIPFMKYADNRARRKELYTAYMQKAFHDNERNNVPLIQEMVALRLEKVQLLGYSTYADYVLEERMAKEVNKVDRLFDELFDKAWPLAQREVEEVKSLMKAHGVEHDLERWDWSYYSEKLKRKKFDFDDELLKPYFKLEQVIDGVFQTAQRLFQIEFREQIDWPVYHPDVKAYEVLNGGTGETQAVFLADFFPRKGKRGGAWMTSFRGSKVTDTGRQVPQVSIVCNFTPSSDGHPSLLKFDEVLTLFHEFGHALHGMLGDTQYGSLSGTNVFWDFVELPSQIMENWCYEKACLDLFARHYETGASIPEAYVSKIKEASTFQEAYQTVRQISLAKLDLAYHALEESNGLDPIAVERKVFESSELFPKVPGTLMSPQFAHIFAGGYAAGYYSYKWAEVLDADAFSLFKENGVFDPKTAQSFRDHILAKGGTAHPMDLYMNFRGKEPDTKALLERAGLVD